MTLGRSFAIALNGNTGTIVEIEVDLAAGLPGVNLIGLPDRSLGEATDRVKSALTNSGFSLPPRKLTVNLSPASLPKRGSAFDLAIALGCLAASGIVKSTALRETVLVGELALDGRLRPTTGVLAAVVFAKKAGYTRVMVATGNRTEAELVPGIDVIAMPSLVAAARYFGAHTDRAEKEPVGNFHEGNSRDEAVASGDTIEAVALPDSSDFLDLADVYGQDDAVMALTVAAAGAHHLFLLGPPGVGKTLLASRLPGILPPLTVEESLDVACIRSLAGLPAQTTLPTNPPLEAPHHTVTVAAMVGGGSGLLRPGVAARANRGVLFLDEATEFSQAVLDTLRQPLESGELSIQRGSQSAQFAARFQLVLAANPCPCGNFEAPGLHCECAPMVRRRYMARISGPLRDRIDIQLKVNKALPKGISGKTHSRATSAEARARVIQARECAAQRFSDKPWQVNAHVPGSVLRSRQWRLPATDTQLIDKALDRGFLTMRGYDRVLRVAWSLADLDGALRPTRAHVSEAMYLRVGQEQERQ